MPETTRVLLKDLLIATKDGDWGKSEREDGYVPYSVIRATDFGNVALGNTGNVPIRYLSAKTVERRTLQIDDILIETAGGSPGRPTGRTMLVTDRVLSGFSLPVTCASFARYMRVDRRLADPRYIYWYLQSLYQSGAIEQYQVQHTGVARFQYTNFASTHKVPIIEMREQKAIAEVLGALDDKIAVNVKLANIADEWIRAEYDLLTTLSSEHRALSEIVINRRNTANPEMLEAKVPYVGLEHIPRRLMWLGEHGSSDEVSSNKSHFKAGDILFGKLRPYFHKIVTAPKAGICSTDVLVLTPMDEALSGFALASLAHDGVVQAVTSASEGTRMPRTSWKDLSSINVPWPGHEAAESFSTRVSAIRDYVIGLMAENQTLAATRDALLPQLMSGKLRVKEVEALGESAV
ncbi:restriction endonuclease subunit S [Glutamicibacter arilaitensis]|uniref:restriction endonuclease subunit S n=1 Tax=Glutamicibacter arilaitensis TaxID=256701 RepID=UPI003F8DE2D2